MISVVIPLYNKEKAIIATLQSVFAQTYTDYELIVVDDGSTDNSLNVTHSFVNSFTHPSFVRIIHKENGGVSSARNRGIKEAKGDFIALLDGDDLWEPTFLEEQVNCYKWEQGMGDGYRGYVEDYFGTKHNDLFCSSSVVIRKVAFSVVGGFDERIDYSEDLDMWYRIILHFPVVFYDKILVYYNQNAENRCAYDLHIHHDLRKCLPFYVDKYEEYCVYNKTFSHMINTLSAEKILYEDYFFSRNKEDRQAADEVASKLRYSDIHPKYWVIFMTPRFVGYCVYMLVRLKKLIVK